MPSQPLTPDAIHQLLQPYISIGPSSKQSAPDWPRICGQLASYLELILHWNARINLTAIRNPEQIVRRHFGESLFAGLHIDHASSSSCDSLLDLGSGAGFPGIPIQLLHPSLPITLAESRTRKAAFLREVIRSLDLRTEVWADRVETLPPSRRFHTVALRAVDDMGSAVTEAARRASQRILILGTSAVDYGARLPDFQLDNPLPLPESRDGILVIAKRTVS